MSKTVILEHYHSAASAHITICGCATDYCVDTTIKVAASNGYKVTVAADAHTTANRGPLKAEQLIQHYNEVWENLIIPGNDVRVKSTQEILQEWREGNS